LHNVYLARWAEFRGKKRSGGNYYLNTVVRNGRRFTRMVIGAYGSGRVSGRDASALLGAKINHFGELAAFAAGRAHRVMEVQP
jgi:hypothetical protein